VEQESSQGIHRGKTRIGKDRRKNIARHKILGTMLKPYLSSAKKHYLSSHWWMNAPIRHTPKLAERAAKMRNCIGKLLISVILTVKFYPIYISPQRRQGHPPDEGDSRGYSHPYPCIF